MGAQGEVEEIDIIVNGGNYGWRNWEGTEPGEAGASGTGPFIAPIFDYTRAPFANGLPQIGVVVVGGYVYRGADISGLAGTYVFADWGAGFTAANVKSQSFR